MTTQTRVQLASESRREFLKTGGALVVTFAVGGGAGNAAAQAAPAKSVAADEVDGFLAIDAKGGVTVFSGKVDLGTGVRTALTQIAAEELSVPLARVTVIQGDTLLTPDQGITLGSLSIQVGGMQIRQAAATARDALLGQAAMTLGVAKDTLTISKGTVTPKSGGKSVSYAQLVGGRDFQLKLDPKAPLKDPKDYTIVGQPVARLDIPDKVTGRFTYMHDFKLKGMIHARVVRPRAMKATLQAWNDFDCRGIPGYIGAIRKGNYLAVLARSEWAAIKASKSVETTWSDWQGLPDKAKLWEYVRKIKINKDEDLQKIGNSAEAMKTPHAKIVSASYDFAIHTHGSIGPSCAVAEYKDGKLTCWSASQQTHLLRTQIANMLGMSPDDVRCIYWPSRTGRVQQAGDVVKGRGVSYVRYELVRTYVGVIADVEVDKKTGKVAVKKFYVAHDCGQIINPDGLKNQIEGNVVQTTSRTLLEELQFDRAKVTSVDWKTYPILKFPDVPDVAIDLIDRPTEKPWGAGEPTAAVVPSAIANAIFDATGTRLRSVPFTPEKVLAALPRA